MCSVHAGGGGGAGWHVCVYTCACVCLSLSLSLSPSLSPPLSPSLSLSSSRFHSFSPDGKPGLNTRGPGENCKTGRWKVGEGRRRAYMDKKKTVCIEEARVKKGFWGHVKMGSWLSPVTVKANFSCFPREFVRTIALKMKLNGTEVNHQSETCLERALEIELNETEVNYKSESCIESE